VVGTFGYMAPEQFQGRASPKSDVYGAAATALAMLTGEEPEDLPHEGLAIDVARAVPQNAPPPLVRALAAMLEPDPDRRASSIDEALAGARRPAPDAHARAHVKSKHEARKEKHRARKEKRRARKEAARERRRERWGLPPRGSGGPAPLFPRLVARLALLVASIAVTATVGFVVPLILNVLSLAFGASLRRAAAACLRAAHESQEALRRHSARLDEPGEPEDARVRVEMHEGAAEEPRPRIANEPGEAGGEREEREEEAEERKRRARARA
jgi:hypothetical protein